MTWPVGRQRKNAEEGPTLLQTDLLLRSAVGLALGWAGLTAHITIRTILICLLALAFTLFVICWCPLLIFFGESRIELRTSVQCPLLCVLLTDPADHSTTQLTMDAEPSCNLLTLEVKAANTLQSKTQLYWHPS
jgi:hypothetical protein